MKAKLAKSVSVFLALLMMLSCFSITVFAKDLVVSLTDETVTPDTRAVTLSLTKVPSSGFCRIFQLDADETFDSSKFFTYDSLATVGIDDLREGESSVALEKAPDEGKKALAVLRDASGDENVDYVSDPVTVTASAPAEKPSVALKTTDVTDKTESVTAEITNLPSGGILRVIEMDEGDAYDSAKLNDGYTSLCFAVVTSLSEGENTLTLTAAPTPGKQLLVVLRDSSDNTDYTSEAVTVTASAPAEKPSVALKTAEVTDKTESVTAEITNLPSGGILRVIEMDEGDAYDSAKLNDGYTSLCFAVVTSLSEGENTLTLTAAPTPGKQLLVVLRDSTDNTDYTSEAVTVQKAASEEPGKTVEEILANCSVTMMENGEAKTGSFQETDTATDVAVKLDDSVESCYLTLYAYPGNSSFDPDADNVNIRLWSGQVQDGYTGTCSFYQNSLPLRKGYKVVASLNVPVGEDYYRPVTSQALEVLDENGQGFTDYTYPDVTIDETELEAGATSLHISLSGDERLFEAAKNKQISIHCSVAQYPDGEDFDFESETQIPLLSNMECTEAFSGKEIQLKEPLRAGWRVRAVVYWSQNVDLFIPKGNDYEAMFHRPDDSVLVSGAAAPAYTAAIDTALTSKTETVDVTLTGEVPEGAVLLLKRFDKGVTAYASNEGVFAGSVQNAKSGSNAVSLQTSLEEGQQLVAFLLIDSAVAAQSEPVVAADPKPFDVALQGSLTPDSENVTFHVTANDEDITLINIAALCKVQSDGTADADDYLTRVFGQEPGDITLDLSDVTINAGDKVCLALKYQQGNDVKTFYSDPVTVTETLAEDSLRLIETEATADTTTLTVEVNGCDDFTGGLLILTTGAPSTDGDGDSRTRIASQTFTGAGSYTLTIPEGKLTAGNTVQAHLYKYDSDADRTFYKYAPSIAVAGEIPMKEPSVEIATNTIRSDRTDVWVITDFDSRLTGTLKLYTYDGDSFDEIAAGLLYSGEAEPKENSQKVVFGADKLTAGQKLLAVLELSDGQKLLSEAKTVTQAPEKEKPQAKLTNDKVTAGMTKVKASLTFDSSAQSARFTLYQFTEDELNTETAEALVSADLSRSDTRKDLYVGSKLKAGAHLQIVFTVDGETVSSNMLTVEPSPDWGTPYLAFATTAVKVGDTEIPVKIDYADEYLAMGDDYYCDVTVYQFPSSYTDEEFEDQELWENFSVAKSVAKINSNFGDETRGELKIPVRETAELKAGDRLIIKLRLPHTEWEDEEVDYVSASIPVVGENEEVPAYKVALYHIDGDTSKGERLIKILNDLEIPFETISDDQLGEKVGYLAGMEGYEKAAEPYAGAQYDTDFMLMCNLPEALLDRFLDAMQDDGLRIDHKAVITAYNADWTFSELLEEIAEEHESFTALIALNNTVKDAEALDLTQYEGAENLDAFREALENAKAVQAKEEPSAEELTAADEALKAEYLKLTGLEEIRGTAVITAERQSDGTYKLTASVKDGNENGGYTYLWSDKTEGAILENVPEQKLIGSVVTVTGEDYYGKLTAQLRVPDAPTATITAKEHSVTIVPKAAAAKDNQPAAETFTAAVYENGSEVKRVSGTGTLTVDGLELDKTYTVKVWAVSPVGGSDRLTKDVTTGHSWNTGYTVDKKPTYTAEGHESIHCMTCSETKNGRAIPKLQRTNLAAKATKTVIGTISAKTYTGKAFTPSPVVKAGGKTLKKGTDYTVKYTNNVKAGTATAIFTGKGAYTGTVKKTFKINAVSVAKAALGNISQKTYAGKAFTPSPVVKVKVNGKAVTLKKGTDYTVKYVKNNQIGTATAVFTGKGNFTGTVKKTFLIKPAKATLKSVSAGKKQLTAKITSVKGGVSYQIAYKLKTAKSWKIVSSAKTTATVKKLTSKKAYQVKVRAIKKVSGKTYYGAWSNAKTVTVK